MWPTTILMGVFLLNLIKHFRRKTESGPPETEQITVLFSFKYLSKTAFVFSSGDLCLFLGILWFRV